MRIGIVSPFAEPEKGAGSIRVAAFSKVLEQKGHVVTVLAPRRSGVPEIRNIQRYIGIFSLMKRIIFSDFDVVIGTSPPLPPNFFCLLACRLKGIPFVFDAKDPALFLLVRLGTLREGSLKHHLYRFFERITHRYSDITLVLTPLDKEEIMADFSVPASKIMLCPNGFDPLVFFCDSGLRSQKRAELKIPDSAVVLLYAGSVCDEKIYRLFENISNELVERFSIFFIVIVTVEKNRVNQDALQNIWVAARKKGLENRLHVFENLPYEQLAPYFSAADVGIAPVPLFWKTCLPVKALDYAGAGIPVLGIAPFGGALDFFLTQSKGGILLSDWNELEPKLSAFLSDREKMQKMGKNARAFASRHFDRLRNAEALLPVLNSLVSKVKK